MSCKFDPFLQRIVWRLTKGNLFMKVEEIKEPVVDPVTGLFFFSAVSFSLFSHMFLYEQRSQS